MKKILTLFTFIFIAFFASGQTPIDGVRKDWSDIRFIINENFDTIYSRVDSLDLIVVSDSIKAVVELTVRDTIINDLIKEHGVWTDYGDSIEFLGKTKTDTLTANESIGIGISHPLSALHINKGTGSLAYGLTFGDGTLGLYKSGGFSMGFDISGSRIFSVALGSGIVGSSTGSGSVSTQNVSALSLVAHNFTNDPNTGLHWHSEDNTSIVAGGKEIARASENVTEQFIINPQGDLTGTAAAPSLAFGDGNTGLYESVDNTLITSTSGFKNIEISIPSLVMRTTGTARVGIFDTGTIFYYPIFADVINNNAASDIKFNVNSIEAMRLTEDSVFMDSTTVVSKIKFSDGTEQITAGAGSTGSVQVARAEVLHTNTIQTTVITLPATAILKAIMYNVFETFDGSGTDLLDIGITGTPTKYFSSEDVTTIKDEGFDFYEYFSTSTNITFTYNDQNADATQGKAYVYVFYSTF